MLGRKVALGAALLTALQLLTKSLDVVFLVIMARLLTPADFGLVALAASVLIIVRTTTELNVSDALVQRKEIDPRDIDTAFTINLLRGLLVTIAMIGTALPMAAAYDDDRLVGILSVLSLVTLLSGLNSPALVHYLRRLEYGPGARMQIVGRLAGFAVAVGLAYVTRSYWALIANHLVTAAVCAGYSYFLAPYRPRFRLAGAKGLLNFAGWVTASRFISTVNLQSDRFLIGHILGKAQLGQYTVGSDMASVATYSFAGPIMQTMFGGFSRLNGDAARTRAAYLKAQQMLVAVLLPFGFGLSVVSDRLVAVMLGPNWDAVVTVVYWLAPVVSLQVLFLPLLSLSMSLGKPRVLVVRESLNFSLRIPLTFAGAWYFGLVGAVIARAIGGIAMILMTLMIAQRFIQISVFRQIGNVWRSLISVSVMVGGVALLKSVIAPSTAVFTQIAQVALFIATGALLYACTHLVLWTVAKRPDGAEQFVLDMIGRRLRK